MTDEQLIEKYRSGDAEALDELLQRYRNLVRARSRQLYLSGGEAEDLIQEGMIGLFKAIRDYKPDKNAAFKSFARMCVSRQLATALKLSNRSKHKPLNSYISFYQNLSGDGLPVGDVLVVSDSGPEDILLDKEALDALEERIDKSLSLMEKQVLTRYIKGLAYMEIAQETGYSKKAIDNALQRIKKKLSGDT